MKMITMPPEFTNLDLFNSETNIDASELQHDTISDFSIPTQHYNAGLTNRLYGKLIETVTEFPQTTNRSDDPSQIQFSQTSQALTDLPQRVDKIKTGLLPQNKNQMAYIEQKDNDSFDVINRRHSALSSNERGNNTHQLTLSCIRDVDRSNSFRNMQANTHLLADNNVINPFNQRVNSQVPVD